MILVSEIIFLSFLMWFLIKDCFFLVEWYLVFLDRLFKVCVLVMVWIIVGCFIVFRCFSLVLIFLKLVCVSGIFFIRFFV